MRIVNDLSSYVHNLLERVGQLKEELSGTKSPARRGDLVDLSDQ
jgi:hypothetical protein